MEIIKSFFIFLKFLFKSKWKISLPKKNKFVLVDGLYNPFLKYLKKKRFHNSLQKRRRNKFYNIIKMFIEV